MGEIAEKNQYWKGKKDIIGEFSDSHRVLMAGVAGQNFSHAPGYLFEASIMLEEVGKNKLSALNYQIVSDAIERELKQTGHDYTQAYKAARIAFELEKQILLTALQQEFADLDAAQNTTKEELNVLFVELDIRKLILITTKTTIDLQMEDLNQQLVETDRLTFYNEERLVSEQVITATKKLEVLPYLEALIAAQEKVLIAERKNFPYVEDLVTEKGLLLDKKNEVLVEVVKKAVEALILADALMASIPIEQQILKQKIDAAHSREAAATGRISIINAEIAVNALREGLSIARASLQEAKVDRQINIADNNALQISTLAAEHSIMTGSVISDDADITSSEVAAEESVSEAGRSAQEGSSSIGNIADISAIRGIASYNAAQRTEVANAQAVAAITSKLVHLLGGLV